MMLGFDRAIFDMFHAWAGISPVWDALVQFSAVYLLYAMALAVVGCLAYVYVFAPSEPSAKALRCMLYAFFAAFMSRVIIAEPLRILIARSRPYELLPLTHQLVEHAGGRSFPSGHAVLAFTIATAVYLYFRTPGLWLFAAAILIAVSRVIAGVHWPSDIFAGALLGVAVAWALHRARHHISLEPWRR